MSTTLFTSEFASFSTLQYTCLGIGNSIIIHPLKPKETFDSALGHSLPLVVSERLLLLNLCTILKCEVIAHVLLLILLFILYPSL